MRLVEQEAAVVVLAAPVHDLLQARAGAAGGAQTAYVNTKTPSRSGSIFAVDEVGKAKTSMTAASSSAAARRRLLPLSAAASRSLAMVQPTSRRSLVASSFRSILVVHQMCFRRPARTFSRIGPASWRRHSPSTATWRPRRGRGI